MTKEFFDKITTPFCPVSAEEISVKEKKFLLEAFAPKGFTSSTFYLRFFQKGFSEWKLIGINECKNQYLRLPDVAETLLKFVDINSKGSSVGDRGYLYTLAHSDAKGVFYECLRKANKGLCSKFFAFMNERGMSTNTVLKRFASDDWKQWELDGIKNMLEPFTKN